MEDTERIQKQQTLGLWVARQSSVASVAKNLLGPQSGLARAGRTWATDYAGRERDTEV